MGEFIERWLVIVIFFITQSPVIYPHKVGTTTATPAPTPTLRGVNNYEYDNQTIIKYSTEAASINQRNLFIKFLENFLAKKLSVNQFNSQLINHGEMLRMFKK